MNCYTLKGVTPEETDMGTDDTKAWEARAELGRVLERNLDGAYRAALELIKLAGHSYSGNSLSDVGTLIRTMSELHNILQMLPHHLDEAKMLSKPESKHFTTLGPPQEQRTMGINSAMRGY